MGNNNSTPAVVPTELQDENDQHFVVYMGTKYVATRSDDSHVTITVTPQNYTGKLPTISIYDTRAVNAKSNADEGKVVLTGYQTFNFGGKLVSVSNLNPDPPPWELKIVELFTTQYLFKGAQQGGRNARKGNGVKGKGKAASGPALRWSPTGRVARFAGAERALWAREGSATLAVKRVVRAADGSRKVLFQPFLSGARGPGGPSPPGPRRPRAKA